jgi:hypothetical protein
VAVKPVILSPIISELTRQKCRAEQRCLGKAACHILEEIYLDGSPCLDMPGRAGCPLGAANLGKLVGMTRHFAMALRPALRSSEFSAPRSNIACTFASELTRSAAAACWISS